MQNLLKKKDVVPFLIPSQENFKKLLDNCIRNKIADLVIQEGRGVSIITSTKETKTLDSINNNIDDKRDFIEGCLADIIRDPEKLDSFMNSDLVKEFSIGINYRYSPVQAESDKSTNDNQSQEGVEKRDDKNYGVEIIDENTTVRLRCTCIKELRGYQINIRIGSISVPNFKDLGISDEFRELFNHKYGLIIIAGPTASGKTTAINSILKDVLLTSNRHLLTLEDPVEYIHKSNIKGLVTYRELGTNFNSYAEGVKNSLRLSPNLILIGEIRDAETANAALEAVLGGHLVISTIHTSSVIQAIQKFVKWARNTQNEENIAVFGDMIRGIMVQKLIKGKPDEKGNQKTIAVREILYGDKLMANAIKRDEGVEYDKIKNKLSEVKSLSISMNKFLIELYVRGEITSVADVFENSNDIDSLMDMINQDKIKFKEIFKDNTNEYLELLEKYRSS